MKNEIEFNNLEEILKSLKTETSPSAEFRQNARIRILNQISESPKKEFDYQRNRFFSFRFAFALVLALLVLSSGTILAAQTVGPKSQLFPVKIASENIALGISPTPIKQKLAVEIVKRRAQELSDSQKSGDTQQIQQDITRCKDSLTQAKALVPSSDTNLNSEITSEEKFLNSVAGYNEGTPAQKGNEKGKEMQDKTEIKTDVNIDLLSPTPQKSNEESVKSDSTVQTEKKGNDNKGNEKMPEASPTFNPVENVQHGVENAIHDLTATPSPQDN